MSKIISLLMERWRASGKGGRNAALYQRCLFPPTLEQRHAERKHSCGTRTCLWLGSPLCVFLFRQRQCETEETQWPDCAPGYVADSAVWGSYCWWLALLCRRVLASVAYIWKRVEMTAQSAFMNKKGHKGLRLWHRRTAHSAVFPGTLVERKWALQCFNEAMAFQSV